MAVHIFGVLGRRIKSESLASVAIEIFGVMGLRSKSESLASVADHFICCFV